MPIPYVIGITGKKRSGKDTVAQRLVELGFTRVAFADPLKTVAEKLNPIVEIQMDEKGLVHGPGSIATRIGYLRLKDVLVECGGWETAKEIRDVRRLLQVLGVSVREEVKMSAWLEAAERRVREIDGPVVIPDVRFKNEAWLIDGWGDLVRVTRPGLVSTDTHISETELDDYYVEDHLELVNDGTVADLHAKVDQLVLHPDVLWKLPAYADAGEPPGTRGESGRHRRRAGV